MSMQIARLGEIIEASIPAFTAQCHRLGEPPPLGAIVRTGDGNIDLYGVVCNASTGSMDPGRHFIALGQDEETEEDIQRSHPELTQLLRTVFDVLVVAHRSSGTVRPHLPPRPARIHAFVHEAAPEEVLALTSPPGFLHTLANATVPTRDDALAACLRLAAALHDDPEAFLVQGGKELARLLARDTQRLGVILRQLRG